MSLNASDTFALGAGLFIFTGCLVFLGIALYVAYTKLEEMLSHLKNCPAVMIKAPFKNGGPWGKLFVLGGIVSVIKTPGLYTPDGGASIEDIANFPKALRARIITLYRVGGYFFSALMLYATILLVDWSSMGTTRLGAVALTAAAIPIWALLCLRLGEKQTSTIIASFKNSSAIKIREKLNTGVVSRNWFL